MQSGWLAHDVDLMASSRPGLGLAA